MPRRRAFTIYSSSEKVVRRRILASGNSSSIFLEASSPSIPFIRISIRRISGRYSLYRVQASSPSEPVAVTSISGFDSRMVFNAPATRQSSSTIIIFMSKSPVYSYKKLNYRSEKTDESNMPGKYFDQTGKISGRVRNICLLQLETDFGIVTKIRKPFSCVIWTVPPSAFARSRILDSPIPPEVFPSLLMSASV